MKALSAITLFASLLATAIAPAQANSTPLNITVDIPFIASLAQEIAGPEALVTTLVSSNDSPHTFSLRPRAVRALQDADLVITVAEELSPNITRALDNVPGTNVINLASAPEVRTLPSRGQHDHGNLQLVKFINSENKNKNNSDNLNDKQPVADEYISIDPHIWLSPVNVQIMVNTLRDELIKIAPLQADLFTQSAKNITSRLQEFDEQQKSRWADNTDRSFVSLHDATHYFENHYQLVSKGSLFADTHTSPGVQQLREIKAIIDNGDVNCVVADTLTSPAWITTLTEGFKVNVVSIDILGFKPKDANYLTTLSQISDSFAQCLGVSTE